MEETSGDHKVVAGAQAQGLRALEVCVGKDETELSFEPGDIIGAKPNLYCELSWSRGGLVIG